jgi:hypothetical protein
MGVWLPFFIVSLDHGVGWLCKATNHYAAVPMAKSAPQSFHVFNRSFARAEKLEPVTRSSVSRDIASLVRLIKRSSRSCTSFDRRSNLQR